MVNRVITGFVCACILSALIATPVSADFREDYEAVVEHWAVESMAKVWDIENGCLTEDASEELLEEAKAKMALLPEDNEHLENLEVIAEVAEDELSKPKMHLYGVCTITHYCNGACCCGPWAGGHTASGTVPQAWHTVAHNYLPFGTQVLIDGVVYTVEDRGDANMANGDWFDIYVNSHEDAYRHGMYQSEVWIIDE